MLGSPLPLSTLSNGLSPQPAVALLVTPLGHKARPWRGSAARPKFRGWRALYLCSITGASPELLVPLQDRPDPCIMWRRGRAGVVVSSTSYSSVLVQILVQGSHSRSLCGTTPAPGPADGTFPRASPLEMCIPSFSNGVARGSRACSARVVHVARAMPHRQSTPP